MKTVDQSSLEESIYYLNPQFITEPGKVSVQVDEDWLDDESSIEPLSIINVYLYTESGKFQTNYRTFKSFLSSLYIQEQLAKMVAPSVLETLVNSILNDIPSHKGPSFVIDSDDIASDIVRNAGILPLYLTEAVEQISECLSFSTSTGRDSIKYLPLVHEDSSMKVLVVTDELHVTIFGDIWYGGVALTMSNSGKLTPTITSFMVRDYDNYVVTLPGVNLRYSAPKNGSDKEDGLQWLEDAVGMAASLLPSEMEHFRHLAGKMVEKDLPAIIKDVLKTVQLPQSLRAKVVTDVINDYDDSSAYGLMIAVGEAQLTEDLSFAILDKTQQAAGKVPSVLGHRCDHCHQLVE